MKSSEDETDAASELLNKAEESDSFLDWLNTCGNSLKSLLSQFKTQKAPITVLLVTVTTLVFILQSIFFVLETDSFPTGFLYILIQPSSLRGLNAHFFLNYPMLAWPASEFLHKGVNHLVANIALLALFGKIVEPRFRTRYYILWFFTVFLIVKPTDALISLSTSSKSHVAVYGISDFVYSLGFYSVLTLLILENRDELEYLGLLVGFAAILHILLEIAQAVWLMSIQPINFSHLIGGVIGLFVFVIVRKRR